MNQLVILYILKKDYTIANNYQFLFMIKNIPYE